MRIAIVSELFPPLTIGGAEVSSMYLAEGLSKDNEVLVLTPNYGKPDETETKGKLTIRRFSFPGLMGKNKISVRAVANPIVSWMFYRKIRKHLDAFDPDVIHAQNSLSFFPVMMYHGRARKIATLRDYSSLCDCGFCSLRRNFVRHGFLGYIREKYRWQPSMKRMLFYPLDYLILRMKQYALKGMDGVICVSDYVRHVYTGYARKSGTIHNIGKFETPRKPKREFLGKVVLYVGKVSLGKGTRHFLETMRIVSHDRTDVTFVIVGDGPMRKDVEIFANEYENVHYLGKVPHERVLELYGMADVVCSTSFWAEPLSRVPIESMSLGVPCVATDVGGTREIIDDGENGFIVEPGNPGQMALKIGELLRDRKLRERFSRNGKDKIRKAFDEDKIVREHMVFYRELMA